MLSYEFFTLQNRFTNRIYRSEVRSVQRPQETDCRASLFFQLSTQWRSNCIWAFSTSKSCISETDQWLYPQLFNIPVCHIVTIKNVTTQSQNAERQILGIVVTHSFLRALLRGWLYILSPIHLLPCESLVDKYPGKSLHELNSSVEKSQQKQRLGGGCWHSGQLGCLEPFHVESKQALDLGQTLPAVSTLVSFWKKDYSFPIDLVFPAALELT